MHFLISIIMMEQGGKRKNLRRFIYCKNIIKMIKSFHCTNCFLVNQNIKSKNSQNYFYKNEY